MKRAIIAAVLISMFLAGDVLARPFNADEKLALELAQEFWGKSPSCTTTDYRALPYEQVGSYGRAGIHGGQCRLWIAQDTMLFDGVCVTVAHEWGHLLLGSVHDSVSGMIMSEDPLPTPQCERESWRRDVAHNRQVRRSYRLRRAKCLRRDPPVRKKCVRRARRIFHDQLI